MGSDLARTALHKVASPAVRDLAATLRLPWVARDELNELRNCLSQHGKRGVAPWLTRMNTEANFMSITLPTLVQLFVKDGQVRRVLFNWVHMVGAFLSQLFLRLVAS